MNNLEINTPVNSELQREMRILTLDTHSPSSRLIGAGIRIDLQGSERYGETYHIQPNPCSCEAATGIYRELGHRAPALLNTLAEATKRGFSAILIRIADGKAICQAPVISAEEKIDAMPSIIAWMTSSRKM